MLVGLRGGRMQTGPDEVIHPRIAAFIACVLACGCGSETRDEADSAAPAESGDTLPDDSSTTWPDTSADTAIAACATDLPSDFACPASSTFTGGTACTEAALEAFVNTCYDGTFSTSAKCVAWTASFAECSKCLRAFTAPAGLLDVGACMHFLAPSSPCGSVQDCFRACVGEVCRTCDRSGGSREIVRCVNESVSPGYSTIPKGRCYDVAFKKLIIDDYWCGTTVTFDLCRQVLPLLRGACRDGGDWLHSGDPGDVVSSDAGSDG